jgi:RNA polymerase sigma-70 factor (ECF subfamily)
MRLLRRQPEHHAVSGADPDALLVQWARQNPQSVTALDDRYFATVDGYCLSQLPDPGAAEDAASQTFLQALAALPAYRQSGRFRSWLFAIAHNTVRTIAADRRLDAPLEAADRVLDSAASPEERALAVLDREWLEAAIARLPADDRQILELRRAGLTGREIAGVLGISHDAAKKRQQRAMDRIRADAFVIPSADQEVRHGA